MAKIKAIFDSKITWSTIGVVVGASYPPAVPLVHAVGDFIMLVL